MVLFLIGKIDFDWLPWKLSIIIYFNVIEEIASLPYSKSFSVLNSDIFLLLSFQHFKQLKIGKLYPSKMALRYTSREGMASELMC